MTDNTAIQGTDFSKLGLGPTNNSIDPATGKPRVHKTTLDQSDFMKLLITQLQNQNPTEPQDNAEFVSQITQFGMLDGIKGMNENFSKLTEAMTSNQALQASSIVGRNVLVPGEVAPYFKDNLFYGTADLDTTVSDMSIQITKESGEIVRSDFVGIAEKGSFPFIWDGTDAAGNPMENGKYKVTATATIDGKKTAIPLNLTYNVDSVTFGKDGKGLMLNLAGGKQVSVDDVREVR